MQGYITLNKNIRFFPFTFSFSEQSSIYVMFKLIPYLNLERKPIYGMQDIPFSKREKRTGTKKTGGGGGSGEGTLGKMKKWSAAVRTLTSASDRTDIWRGQSDWLRRRRGIVHI